MSNCPYTPEEDAKLLRLVAEGLGPTRIAERMNGRSRGSVSGRMVLLGLSKSRAPAEQKVRLEPRPMPEHPAIASNERLRDLPLMPAIQAQAFNGRVWRAT